MAAAESNIVYHTTYFNYYRFVDKDVLYDQLYEFGNVIVQNGYSMTDAMSVWLGCGK